MLDPRVQERRAAPRDAPPLRLGVVGLGAVAQAVHLPLLAKHPDLFAPVAVCDLSRSTRDSVGARLGVPERRRFEDADELIAAGDLDAVCVLSSGSHGALALEALNAGAAVFCEKPLAFTVAEADALAAAAPRLQLGYMKLYDPAVARARELLADRPRARSVEVTVLHPPAPPQLAHAGLPPAAADADPARLEALALAERALVEQALGDVPGELGELYTGVLLGSVVHDLAVMRHLLGGPLEIGYGDVWQDGRSVELLGQLPGGTHVSIRWHYLERYPAYSEEVRVHDDEGTVSLVFQSPYLLHAPTTLTVVDADGEAARVTQVRSTVEAFESQWLAFAELALDARAPLAGVAEGRADIVACQQAAAAIAERQEVVVGGEAVGAPHETGQTTDGGAR